MEQTGTRSPPPAAQWLALLLPAALLGGAYIAQYGFGLYPCEMCWWQRYPHFLALPFAVLGFFVPPRRLWILLAALSVFGSGLIGAFHAGVEYGWWEGLTACATTVSSGGDALEAIMKAPVIRCDQAPWTLLGVSLAGFNFLVSCGGAALVFILLFRGKRA